MKNKKTIPFIIYNIIWYVSVLLFLFIIVAGKSVTNWYEETFQTSFREIIYTFRLGIEGADSSFMKNMFIDCKSVFFVYFFLAVLFTFAYFRFMRRRSYQNDSVTLPEKSNLLSRMYSYVDKNYFKSTGVFLVALLLISLPTLKYTDDVLKVGLFLKSRYVNTDLYDDYYVNPNSVKLKQKKGKKNVIIIYLESMETTYASKKLGGNQKDNLIPHLTEIANENISFGDRNKGMLGGTHNPSGTTWTTGSLLASSSGVPFAFRVGINQLGKEKPFAKGLVCLGDILEKRGYNQMFLCGSDAVFGGKKALFKQHGNYKIYDYYSAIEDDYIDKDYKVWWGLEDHILYEIAKDRLTQLSRDNKPFNFTMLTVDTHHVGGYVCDYCPDVKKEYGDTGRVVMCADSHIYNFLEWCKYQPFYSNTSIVIIGDHPRMDKELVKGMKYYDREAYNCFINSSVSPGKGKKRTATTMDLFPTILSSMGFEIPGDRLGLGTNLFSKRKTLAEELTYEKLGNELEKNSNYYLENFE